MNFNLPEIYPITDTRIAKLSHAEQTARLIEGGAKLIQLREKNDSPRNFYENAKKALKIARARNVKIIINDRVDIALALKADGVHLGQDDLPPKYARRILGKNAIIGFSAHNVAQASEALNFPISYLAIGPVFETKTKINPEKQVGIEGLIKVRQAIGGLPLVAIGGISLENFSDVLQAGANSAAIIGSVLSDADNIAEKMSKFIAQSKNITKNVYPS